MRFTSFSTATQTNLNPPKQSTQTHSSISQQRVPSNKSPECSPKTWELEVSPSTRSHLGSSTRLNTVKENLHSTSIRLPNRLQGIGWGPQMISHLLLHSLLDKRDSGLMDRIFVSMGWVTCHLDSLFFLFGADMRSL